MFISLVACMAVKPKVMNYMIQPSGPPPPRRQNTAGKSAPRRYAGPMRLRCNGSAVPR
jgi:hypothetical protein